MALTLTIVNVSWFFSAIFTKAKNILTSVLLSRGQLFKTYDIVS